MTSRPSDQSKCSVQPSSNTSLGIAKADNFKYSNMNTPASAPSTTPAPKPLITNTPTASTPTALFGNGTNPTLYVATEIVRNATSAQPTTGDMFRSTSNTAATPCGAFGPRTNSAPTAVGLFGNQTNTLQTPAARPTSGGLFSGHAVPPANTGGLFGNTSSGNTTQGGLFGGSNLFGNKTNNTSTQGGLFSGGSLFRDDTKPPVQGSLFNGGLFGTTGQQSFGGLFGRPLANDKNTSIVKSGITSTIPSNQVEQLPATVNPPDTVDRYLCTDCKGDMALRIGGLSPTMFHCWSCTNSYHKQCPKVSFPATTDAFELRDNNVNYHGLEICKYCHVRMEDTTRDPVSTFPQIFNLTACKAEDTKPMLRRSTRDLRKIAECEAPDSIAIVAEHFGELAATPSGDTGLPVDEPDEDDMSVEPLFQIGDSVTLLPFRDRHPDYNKSFVVIARLFDGRQDIENDDIDEVEPSATEGGAANPPSITQPHPARRGGWYYRLDEVLTTNAGITPDLVMWHEDNLELALEDDSSDCNDDEQDTDMEDATELELDDQERNGEE